MTSPDCAWKSVTGIAKKCKTFQQVGGTLQAEIWEVIYKKGLKYNIPTNTCRVIPIIATIPLVCV
jgi:hypothetical protein